MAGPSGPTESLSAKSPFAFPWDDALALGLHALRWTPATFWTATPRELAAAAGCKAAPAAGRGDLDRLIAAFPDP